jgi:hypothetical protein
MSPLPLLQSMNITLEELLCDFEPPIPSNPMGRFPPTSDFRVKTDSFGKRTATSALSANDEKVLHNYLFRVRRSADPVGPGHTHAFVAPLRTKCGASVFSAERT